MRAAKKYLVDEVASHLNKSEYLFLADYTKLNVPETAELRDALTALGAEFHVVKNSILKVAAEGKGYPDFSECLEGQTGIVVGGEDYAAIAKAINEFAKKKEKLSFKVGIIGLDKQSAEELKVLAELPSMDSLRVQLLGLLNTPASSFVRLLDAYAKKQEESAA